MLLSPNFLSLLFQEECKIQNSQAALGNQIILKRSCGSGADMEILIKFANWLRHLLQDVIGKILFTLAYHVVPIRNYRFKPKLQDKPDEVVRMGTNLLRSNVPG